MLKMNLRAAGTAALMSALLCTAGCQSSGNNANQTPRPAQDSAQSQPATAQPVRNGSRFSYSPAVGADRSVVGLPFPTGDEATSALILHQVMPVEARLGQEFPVEYHVTNVTGGTLQNVAVLLESRSNLNVVEANPEAMSSASGMTWSIGDLGAGETQIIYISATADETGVAGNCVSVSYNNSLCATTVIVDPELTIAKQVTPRVLRCDPIEIVYTVCNPGTGVAEDVVVMDRLPNGLTVNGSSTVNVPVGALAAGECRDITVIAMADGRGEFCSPAMASAAGGLEATSTEPCTVVVQPELDIVCEARESQFLGRNSTFEFTVTNDGDGVSANTVVTANLPGNATFVSASRGGTVAGSSVVWSMGDLAPGDSRTVSVDVSSNVAGNIQVSASVSGDCADTDTTRCSTRYEGIPAILLEVVDLIDPVEVGELTTYRITVTNQGTADDNDIVVQCTMPDELEFVSATGATEARRNGQVVTFRPVPTLAPGAVAVWELTVRSAGEGDIRFAVEMTSAEKTRPVRETESTTLYR